MWQLSAEEGVSLRAINEKLKTLQDKLLAEAISLDSALRVRVEDTNDPLDDYEIELRILFCLKENHPNFIEDEDNILTQIHEYLKGISINAPHYPWRWSDNHNEYRGWAEHPMKNEHHCWWFHCLYDHNHLKTCDILSIGRVWSDIIVSYQYVDSLE